MRWHVRTMLVLMALGVAACATTTVKAVWKDEAYQARPKKVLVIALFKNQSLRRMVEDEFTNYLKYRGTDAAAGYGVLPGNELPAKEAVAEQIKAKGFDALLLTRLIDSRTETRIVTGSMSHTMPMRGYYGYGYSAVYSPDYQVEDRYATVESSLYDAATEKLIWTATSETWMSEGDQKLAKTYVAVMMESLRKQKIVP